MYELNLSMSKKRIKKIKTGVIGVGSMGQNHARVYSEVSNLVGVYDNDYVQAKKVAERFDVKAFQNFSDFLNSVEAVSIAVPTIIHKEMSFSCAENGVNILVEKPMSYDSKSSQEIIDFCNKKNIILSVGHIERHSDIVKYSKEKLSSGGWGEVINFSSRRVSNHPDRIKDVGVLFDLSIHDVDIIAYLADCEVSAVYAAGGRAVDPNNEDYVNLILHLSNGKIAYIENNWLTPMKTRELTITTTTHKIILDYLKQEVGVYSSKFKNLENHNLYKVGVEINEDIKTFPDREPLKNEIEDFLNSIVKHTSPLVSGKDGLRAIRIVEAAQESLNSGEKVKVKFD